MKILIATSIYPPKIGGPSQYVKNLEKDLKEKGIENEVISYNNLNKYPQPLRFLFYCFLILKRTTDNDIIYAFNLISCGIPAYLASILFNKRFILRLGGDFLWERAVEEGRTKKPLKYYYQEPKTLKERFFTYLIKGILNGADKIIFTSNFLKEIYREHFNVEEEKITIIKNPFPEVRNSEYQSSGFSYQILYAGRIIKLKNLETLLYSFATAIKKTKKPFILKIIGEGPEKNNLELKIKALGLEPDVVIKKSIPHQELLKEIEKSYFCILPSLSEVSPNFALECIKLKKPILLTKETGIYEDFKDHLIFINPEDEKEIEDKILYLLDEDNYRNYLQKIKSINIDYSWDEVVKKHILLFKELLKA